MVQLEYPRKDGTRLADSLDQVEFTTGERPPGSPVVPDIPLPVQGLWGLFWELSSTRGSTGFGPAALTFTEIRAWQELVGYQLTPWEVGALKDMDVAYLRAVAAMEK